MQQLISVLENIGDFTSVNIETIVKDWMTKNEIGMGKVMQPFRLSLVGALKGPHLFDIVELIGKEETPDLMKQLQGILNTIEDFNAVTIETIVKNWMTQNEIGMGKVMQPFRLSLVGALKGPHLFDIVELIGKEETIKRLEKAIERL